MSKSPKTSKKFKKSLFFKINKKKIYIYFEKKTPILLVFHY